MINLYTDGSYLGKFNVGGWCSYIKEQNNRRIIFGSDYNTTNNRMELKAVIEGLYLLDYTICINIYTDSIYLKNGITNWIFYWKNNNWRCKNGKYVKNIDMWVTLYNIVKKYICIKWYWVKSHNVCLENNIVDKIARRAATKLIA